MFARALSLLVILPSFAFGLLFIGSDGFAPPEPHGCGNAQMAALMVWVLGAVVAVCVPGLLGIVRVAFGKRGGDLGQLAGLALAGHAALVGVWVLRDLLG